MMINKILNVFKARTSFPVDLDLDKEQAHAKYLKEKYGVTEPRIQKSIIHRGFLLKLMAVFYTLFLFDNCWTITTEFKSYDDIKRCPELTEPEFLNTEELELESYYTGYWESCGAETPNKQYRYVGQNGTSVKATGSQCFYSEGRGYTHIAVPFTNIKTSTVSDWNNNMAEFQNKKYDQVNENTVEDPSVFVMYAPSMKKKYSTLVTEASKKLFATWKSSVTSNPSYTPKCESDHVNIAGADFQSQSGDETTNYNMRCFTDSEGEAAWYYWESNWGDSDPGDEQWEDWDLVLYYTHNNNSYTGQSTCGDLPAIERDCCSSEEVLISSKNSPKLIKVRKAMAIVKIAMNALSALLSIVAAFKWNELALSRKCALGAWLVPFVVSCVLAMLPLAAFADLKSAQLYDDSLTKSLDDADVDSIVKYLNIMMPEPTQALHSVLKSFINDNKDSGHEVSDMAMQVEFRLKTMAGTLLPLALTALALPGGITKASIQVKELFPSITWIGWLIRLMPVFYLPWAAAIFCSLCQIFAGAFVTCAVACFLLMKVIDLSYNPSVHTKSHISHEEYRKARAGSKAEFVVLKILLLCTVVFLILAMLTDKYLKRLGLKAMLGELGNNLGPETGHFIISFIFGFIAKSSNTIVMFTDMLLVMVSFIAISETQKDDQRAAEALKECMISPEKAAADAPAAV